MGSTSLSATAVPLVNRAHHGLSWSRSARLQHRLRTSVRARSSASLHATAARYYLYKHHQASAQTGPDSQYYLSKNGRVYYRDADHRAHWVTPPTEGLRVPESEAADYRHFQGYDGNANGRDLAGISNDD